MGIEFINNIEEINQALEDAIIKSLYEVAGEVEGAAISASPVDQGDLKGAWAYRVDEDESKAYVGNTLENSLWNEFGTGAWAEGGKGRKDAWYVPVEGYTGKKKPTFNGKVVIVYGKEGRQYYKTNGKKPQRTLQRAFNEKKNIVKQIIENNIKNAMSK